MNELINSHYEELYHHGVKGMKWGHRKKVDYASKAKVSRQSAREWNEMARYAEAKGKTKKAAKYRANAKKDIADAQSYERQAGPRKSTNINKTTKTTNTTKTTKSSPAKKVNSGKKKAKKIMQSGVRATGKTVGWGAQVAVRMLQNNVVFNTTGNILDNIYYR